MHDKNLRAVNRFIVDENDNTAGESYRWSGPSKKRDAKANATLWAAAPELLEACEAARDEIALCLDGDNAWGWPGNLPFALRKLRIAIAKASSDFGS